MPSVSLTILYKIVVCINLLVFYRKIHCPTSELISNRYLMNRKVKELAFSFLCF